MKKIVCISREFYLDEGRNIIKGEYEPDFTLGKVYDLIEYPPTSYRSETIFNFLDDRGQERSYKVCKICFITLEQWMCENRENN